MNPVGDKSWAAVGSASDFLDGVHLVRAGQRKVVLARLEGVLFAFSPLCPHVAGNMERCEVRGTIVTCPFHAWRFDLADNGREIHGYDPLRVFPVKTILDTVYVEFKSIMSRGQDGKA